MNKLFLLIALTLGGRLLAQKPPIDTSVFDRWWTVGNPAISNDGQYALYTIQAAYDKPGTLVIEAVSGNWKKEIAGASKPAITQDSRRAVFMVGKDSLCLQSLGGPGVEYLPGVKAYQLVQKGSDELLAFQLTSPRKELVIRDLRTGNQRSFPFVIAYLFSHDGKNLVMQTEAASGGATTQEAVWVDLASGHSSTIWQGEGARGWIFDATGDALAFMAVDKTMPAAGPAVWYYHAGSDKAVVLADENSAGIDKGLKIDNINFNGFSPDGSRLWITLKEKDCEKPPPGAIMVDLWSYTDPKLQSQQLDELDPTKRNGGPKSYLASVGIDNHQITRWQLENEVLNLNGKSAVQFVSYVRGNPDETNWSRASRSVYYLAFPDGKRRRINQSVVGFSPGGKYAILCDSLYRNFSSYELATGVVRNLTRSLPIPLFDPEYDDNPRPPSRRLHLAAWLADDAGFLLYDKFDIWQIDPSGKAPAVDITDGYGRKHNIIFHLAERYRDRTIGVHDKIILVAFNRNNKENGFYCKTLGTRGGAHLLTMGPYCYHFPDHYNPSLPEFVPLKARDADVYLVRRESASESPNYFITRDFRTFQPLSQVYPEKEYNWLTTQLLTWKTTDGTSAQGVLYKPEDFDPTKKYPLIIHYYEKMSDNLNKYEKPAPISDFINIPLFVSRGYLVFTPDIHYKMGYPGASAENSIVSAAKFLAKKPWVDARHMGIQGHSWAGYETLYVVTHSDLFAAAMASSGLPDFISDFNSIIPYSGEGLGFFYERHQSRMGFTLWQRPDLYISNSPIFRADKVTTPLLMMNNMDDGIIPFAQGVEFFTAMRRLGKKAWMLQYDKEAHSVIGERAKMDYTVRMSQFFDHYLKGAAPPEWMTQGIPARRKGIDYGLRMDDSVNEPGLGLLLNAPSNQLTITKNSK